MLNPIHQVTAVDEFHDEIQSILDERRRSVRPSSFSSYHCLKARVQLNEKFRLITQHEHSFFDHDTFDIIILDDDVFLQDLHSEQFLAVSLPFGKQDLTSGRVHRRVTPPFVTHFAERALAKDFDEVEIRYFDRVRLRIGAHHGLLVLIGICTR